MLFLFALSLVSCRHAKLDEVAVLVAEAPIPMDYGPWKKMSQEGVDFLHACLDRDYHQRMTVRQVRVVWCAGPAVPLYILLWPACCGPVLRSSVVFFGVSEGLCCALLPCCAVPCYAVLCCRR